MIIPKLESAGNSDKIRDSDVLMELSFLQIKAPRSKLPAFISCLKKRLKCLTFYAFTQTLEGTFPCSSFLGLGSADLQLRVHGQVEEHHSPLRNNPNIGLLAQPSHPREAHPVICPHPTLAHGSCLRSNPGFLLT